MKRFIPVLLLAFTLGACSTSQLTAITNATTTYDNAVQNFNAAAAAISGSIALTSQAVGPYCNALLTAGSNLKKLTSNETITTALNSSAAALNQYCIAMPADIQGAIVALTAAAVAAKQAAQGG